LAGITPPRKIIRITKSKSQNIIVARLEGELVGFGIMTYRKDQANLDLLAVKEDYRRSRIGSQIVLWLEKVATTAGAFNVFVQLRETNSGAFALYENLGYEKLDVFPGYYKGIENGVVMAKSLRTMINAT
jgi:ribosomal-protein-alanine N-acetyltransferase